MAGASRDRVTITLGRRGQVVKRVSSNVDASFSGSSPVVGVKRSIRDRLGSNGSLFHGNGKRQRGDIGTSRAKNSDGTVIDKGDLRLKLMRKNASKKVRRDSGDRKFGEDLRDKLKRARKMPIRDSVRHPDEKKESGGFSQATSARSSDGFPKMQPRSSRRDSYSQWGIDHYGRGSLDGAPHTSMGISPQRSVEDIHRGPLPIPFNNVRSVPFMSKSIVETTRPMGSGTFQSSTVFPPLLGLSKPIAPSHLSQHPPPSSILPKVPYMVDEQQAVEGLLQSLGLAKYVVIFKAEEVDMTALKQMGENDLKELGIPMGPRKKILLALLPPHSKRPA